MNFPSGSLSSERLRQPEPAQKPTNSYLQQLEQSLFCDDDDGNYISSAAIASKMNEMQHLLHSDNNGREHPMQQNFPLPQHAPQNRVFPPPLFNSTSSLPQLNSMPTTPAPAVTSRQLLLETAAAIEERKKETVVNNLKILYRRANPEGDAEQRLTAMMILALTERVKKTRRLMADLCGEEQQKAMESLCQLSNFYNHSTFTANQTMLDATSDSTKIHIIDFNLGTGSQLATLITTLSQRHHSRFGDTPLAVKVTVVCNPTSTASRLSNGTDGQNLRKATARVEGCAARARVQFQLNVVDLRATELDKEALGCEPDEALVVNLAFHMCHVADKNVSQANPRDEMLRRLRLLEPRVLMLVEHDIDFNNATFMERFKAASGHFGAMLESFEATMLPYIAARKMCRDMEKSLCRRAVNALAWDGTQRVERCETFDQWRARMENAGLRPVQLPPAVVKAVRAKITRCHPGFTYKEDANRISFGWRRHELTFASAWH